MVSSREWTYVSELYGRGIYYLPHVMVAADAMDKGIKIAESSSEGRPEDKGHHCHARR